MYEQESHRRVLSLKTKFLNGFLSFLKNRDDDGNLYSIIANQNTSYGVHYSAVKGQFMWDQKWREAGNTSRWTFSIVYISHFHFCIRRKLVPKPGQRTYMPRIWCNFSIYCGDCYRFTKFQHHKRQNRVDSDECPITCTIFSSLNSYVQARWETSKLSWSAPFVVGQQSSDGCRCYEPTSTYNGANAHGPGVNVRIRAQKISLHPLVFQLKTVLILVMSQTSKFRVRQKSLVTSYLHLRWLNVEKKNAAWTSIS